MSDTILGGDFTIYYLAETRRKQIVWTGSATGTRTVNQLYSAVADLFDDLNQMDDGVPMSAQTPTQYTLGIIDPSDAEPWFIDRTSVEHLTGGALTTASWSRTTGTKTGIVRVAYTIGTDFATTDIGKTVSNATSLSTGTLLDFNTVGATKYMWIRPTSSASTHDWGGAVGTVTVTAGSAASVTQSAVAKTGDSLWANLFSLGTIVTPGTHMILYQNDSGNRVLSYKSTTVDWWPDGQIDMLLPTKELGLFNDGLAAPVMGTTSTATTGGTLAANTYFYKMTALNAQGETVVSNEVSQVTTGATSTVTVNWTTITGATGYKIYRSTSTGTELYIQQVGVVTTLIDTGFSASGAMPTKDTTGGIVTVFARQYDQTYTDFTANVSTGGRNPIPLAAGSDLNNTTGYRSFTSTSGTGTFVVGEIIYQPAAGTLAAATATGILTKVVGSPGTTPTLDYYLIMSAGTGLFTDFANTNTIKGNTSAGTCTSAAPSNVVPAGSTITIAYGADNTFDIPQSGTNQNYSIVIDLKSTESVAKGYEFTKYLTRADAGTNAQLPTNVTGQSYLGADTSILYATITGTISVGDVVTQLVSRAVGTVIANNTAPTAGSKYLILRNSNGTFDSTNAVQKDSSNFVSTPTVTAITPIHAAPFGTFAGGTWFCAPGVVLKNRLAADANKYQLVDDNGTVRKEPTSVSLTVSNTRAGSVTGNQGDGVSVFELVAAGGIINKTKLTATVQSIGATTAVTSASLAANTPGKSAGGVVRLVQGQTEFRLRYNSWATTTFTLASRTAIAATVGTTTTDVFATAATFVTWGILVGDIVRNTTHAAIGYVTQVVSETEIKVTTMAGFVSTDTFELNTLPVATTGSDNYYVPLMDVVETTGTDASTGSQTRTLVYTADVPVVVRIRHNTSGDTYNILPFETTGTVTSAGLSVSTIRTKDTIAT